MRLLKTSQIFRSRNEEEFQSIHLWDSVDVDDDSLEVFTSVVVSVILSGVVGTIVGICWTSVVVNVASVVKNFVVVSSTVVDSTSLFRSVLASTCCRGDSERKAAKTSEAKSNKFLKFWRAIIVTKQLFLFWFQLWTSFAFFGLQNELKNSVASSHFRYCSKHVMSQLMGGIQFEVLKWHKNTN